MTETNTALNKLILAKTAHTLQWAYSTYDQE